jgi:hypothetical protein
MPELVVQKLELLRLVRCCNNKEAPHDIQMPQQAKTSKMSAYSTRARRKYKMQN